MACGVFFVLFLPYSSQVANRGRSQSPWFCVWLLLLAGIPLKMAEQYCHQAQSPWLCVFGFLSLAPTPVVSTWYYNCRAYSCTVQFAFVVGCHPMCDGVALLWYSCVVLSVISVCLMLCHSGYWKQIARGGPGPNKIGSPPSLEFQELNSRFLFPVHFLLCFSAFWLSLFPLSFCLADPFTNILSPNLSNK